MADRAAIILPFRPGPGSAGLAGAAPYQQDLAETKAVPPGCGHWAIERGPAAQVTGCTVNEPQVKQTCIYRHQTEARAAHEKFHAACKDGGTNWGANPPYYIMPSFHLGCHAGTGGGKACA